MRKIPLVRTGGGRRFMTSGPHPWLLSRIRNRLHDYQSCRGYMFLYCFISLQVTRIRNIMSHHVYPATPL